MASPVVQTTAESATTTAGTSHAITLPASIDATDMVLIIMDIGSTSATANALTDWAEILDENAGNGLKIWRYTGTGVPGNPTFTLSANTRSASIAFRISGADKSVTPQIGTTATGTSTSPNPPSVTPTGGVSKDYLAIAFFGSAGEEADDDTWVNSPPTNYLPNPPLQKTAGTAGTNLGGLIGAASLAFTSGSAQDPGTFSIDTSAAWRAQTILIHPAQLLTGTLFQSAPTFFQGAITPGAVNLAGSLFQRAPTFFTGAITSTYPLTGTLFQKAPTFFTGEVTQEDSAQDLAGVLFQSAPTFFQGEVVRLLQELTGTIYQSAPTFFEGAVTPGAVDLAGVLFQKAPTFPTGAVTTGPVDVAGVLFQSAPTFFTGVVVRVVPHGAPPVEAPGNAGGGTAPSQFAALGAELGTRGLSEASTNTGQSSATGASGGSDV